ncbi:CAAX protease family protein [Halobiforma lacisalsi AJ5]|uniref:Abortive infection protein n=1 Tax=Natronobacterium lacisalsi AJ5 TaxID=358396 RepID=M0L308_NATLA|nr:CPBP family intramembrane glutamic endopeptidase [Halobiforma lacisalsi]APW98354.1 CAAX protease family protein [Halobiforma lacisalsi AJ5]EMA27957.1 abortive infection protein [Halobiforma lacisalsi AJ5]
MTEPSRLRRLVSRIVRGRDDPRPRAIWRIAVPLLTVLVIGAGVVPGVLSAAFGLEPAPPWAGLLSNGSAAAVAALVLVGSARALDRRPIAEYGFDASREWGQQFGIGVLFGGAVLGFAYGIGYAVGSVRIEGVLSPGSVGSLPLGIAAFAVVWLCVGFWEEVVFRGLFVTNATEGLASRSLSPCAATVGAVVVSSVVFGSLHAPASAVPGNASLAGMLVVWTLMGGLLAVTYVLTGRLAAPIGVHFAINFAANNILAAPVPGQPATPTIVRTAVTGPGLWHPIGGLPMVIAVAAGYAVLAGWWVRQPDGTPMGWPNAPGRTDS